MIIDKIQGNLKKFNLGNREKEIVNLEWFEVDKKILKKSTSTGRELGIRNETGTPLKDEDILYVDEKTLICVNILECEVIEIKPSNDLEGLKAAYEIGNRHIPMFVENDSLLVAYDRPLFQFLEKLELKPQSGRKKLQYKIGSCTHGHSHE